MPNFRNPHPVALERPSHDGVTPSQTVEPGEVVEAATNPAPGWLEETKTKPAKTADQPEE